MKIDRFIRAFAGVMILASLALTLWVSPWWLTFTAFIGLNLFQSAFTGFCPPSIILRRIGWLDDEGVVHFGRRRP